MSYYAYCVLILREINCAILITNTIEIYRFFADSALTPIGNLICKMSELDWDDPNYVEKPTKYAESTFNENDADNYSRGRRSGYGGSSKKRDREQRGSYDSSNRHESYDRDIGSSWRNAEYAYSESLNISSDMIGRIIGRGGSNITRIQQDFSVRVDVDKGRRTVTVSGSEKGNVTNALDEIRRQIQSDGGGYGQASEGGTRGRSYGQSDYGRSGDGKSGRYEDRNSDRSNGKRERSSHNSYGAGRNIYDFAPSSAKADDGDLTGTIDWAALNKASVRWLSIKRGIQFKTSHFNRKLLRPNVGRNVHR